MGVYVFHSMDPVSGKCMDDIYSGQHTICLNNSRNARSFQVLNQASIHIIDAYHTEPGTLRRMDDQITLQILVYQQISSFFSITDAGGIQCKFNSVKIELGLFNDTESHDLGAGLELHGGRHGCGSQPAS